ncbi:MAG: hypothetical protein M3322_08175 [Actinomycetota bacterium]|nr:hypothetical protein [Actinomycetota bacterium]
MKRRAFVAVGVLAAAISLGLSLPASAQQTGILQVCKVGLDPATRAFQPGFTFTIGGTQTTVVPAGTAANPLCSPAITLPAGTVTVRETVPSGFSLVRCFGLPDGNLVSFNPATGVATATIRAGGVELQTIVVCENRAILAVQLQSFTAQRVGKNVVLRWRTASEVNTLGYNVYRQAGAKRVKLNRSLIPAASLIGGSTSSHAYSFRTRIPSLKGASAKYWLQEVASNGARSWYGPVRAVAAS